MARWIAGPSTGMARITSRSPTATVEARLESLPGKQLAIVHYAPDHSPLDEWVYNAPDIAHSKVIWARDMGPAENLDLIRYYKNRTVWLVPAGQLSRRPHSLCRSGAGSRQPEIAPPYRYRRLSLNSRLNTPASSRTAITETLRVMLICAWINCCAVEFTLVA